MPECMLLMGITSFSLDGRGKQNDCLCDVVYHVAQPCQYGIGNSNVLYRSSPYARNRFVRRVFGYAINNQEVFYDRPL
jgi:hypothetical protein